MSQDPGSGESPLAAPAPENPTPEEVVSDQVAGGDDEATVDDQAVDGAESDSDAAVSADVDTDEVVDGAEEIVSAEEIVKGPIIVLAGMRSGSTLLRFILDSHPALACPAETYVADICDQQSRVWRQLEGTGRKLSPIAKTSIRAGIDAMFDSYLSTAGKQRWCDKSLDSAKPTWTFAKVYPEARYICVYRHCLDVIDSGLEAFNRGVDDETLAPFVARHPRNLVAALAEYWLRSTRAIIKFERGHPAKCHRILYEELVSTPETSAAEMFRWLGEVEVPGITRTCFEDDHGRPGRSDYKIWATSRVSRTSVGRGTRVPINRIPARLRRQISALLRNLGYPPLGTPYRGWSDASETDLAIEAASEADDTAKQEIDEILTAHLTERLESLSTIPESWAWVLGRRTVKISVLSTDASPASHWLASIDPPQATYRPIEPESGAAWTVLAEAAPLLAVMRGELNLASAMRQRRIRITKIAPIPKREGQVAPRPRLDLAHVRSQILVRLFVPPAPSIVEPSAAEEPDSDESDDESDSDEVEAD